MPLYFQRGPASRGALFILAGLYWPHPPARVATHIEREIQLYLCKFTYENIFLSSGYYYARTVSRRDSSITPTPAIISVIMHRIRGSPDFGGGRNHSRQLILRFVGLMREWRMDSILTIAPVMSVQSPRHLMFVYDVFPYERVRRPPNEIFRSGMKKSLS